MDKKWMPLGIIATVMLSVLNGCASNLVDETTSRESKTSMENVTSAIVETSEQNSSAESISPDVSTEVPSTEEITTEIITDPMPITFIWNPYVYNDVSRELYGEETEQSFYAMVRAVMNGEDQYACMTEDTMYVINRIAKECFPIFEVLVSGISYQDGFVYLTYAVSDEQREQLLKEFEDQVTWIIESAVMQGDTSEMAALALYHSYSAMITYDYDGLLDNEMVSPYRGIMELDGICQTFAGAFAYLCLQCDIDATVASGMNETDAHEWTLIKLNGNYYYVDTTFESGDGGFGLRYFGMTGQQREASGGYPAEDYNIANANLLWGRDIAVNDERYKSLWEVWLVKDILRDDGEMRILCERLDGTQFEFVVGEE